MEKLFDYDLSKILPSATAGTKHVKLIYLFLMQKGKCFYCGREFVSESEIINFNIDHKIPSSRGGKDSLDNYALSCVSCNTLKANMTHLEFMEGISLVYAGKINKHDLQDYGKYLILKRKFHGV